MADNKSRFDIYRSTITLSDEYVCIIFSTIVWLHAYLIGLQPEQDFSLFDEP